MKKANDLAKAKATGKPVGAITGLPGWREKWDLLE